MKPGAFDNALPSFKKRNPHLFGLGAVEASLPKPADVQALVPRTKERKTRQIGVEVWVTLCVICRRPYDDDNLSSACKPLRDAIADELGVNDGDRRIHFRYGQICGPASQVGDEGVMVKVSIA